MKKINKILTFISLIVVGFFVAVPTVKAEVVVNEISPSEEWVELYNFDSTEVNLNGYELSMGSDSQKIVFTSADTVQGNSFKVLQKDVTPGWSANWLNNDGDSVQLKKIGGLVEVITYGGSGNVCAPDSKTIGRFPDGTNFIDKLSSASKGSANTFDTSLSCNPPTPTPTASPISTPTPTPTITPTPTPVATKSPTPKPTKSPISTSSPTNSNVAGVSAEGTPGDISGLRDQLYASENSANQSQPDKKSPPVVAIVLVGGGMVLMVFGLFVFLKHRQTGYN